MNDFQALVWYLGALRLPADYCVDWTSRDANTAQDQWEEALPPGYKPDEREGPYRRWLAASYLDEDKKQFEQGDGKALIGAVWRCLEWGLPTPFWVMSALTLAYTHVLIANIEKNSWDEVLGTPFPKRTHMATIRKRRSIAARICIEVKDLRLSRETSSDSLKWSEEELFEEVVRKLQLHISWSEARKIWNQNKERFAP